MSVRDTSAQAYYQIRDEGLLSRRRFEIYKILYTLGPMTASQIQRHMTGSEGANKTNAHARLFEMRDMLCIAECGKVRCPVTGMTVINWDVTSKLPKPLPKELTNKQKIERYRLLLNNYVNHPELPDTIRRTLVEDGRKLGLIKQGSSHIESAVCQDKV